MKTGYWAVALTAIASAACNAAPAPSPGVCGALAESGADAANARLSALRVQNLTPAMRLAVEQQYADACLRRWSYRLAKAEDGAPDIADAVVTRCEAELHDRRRAAEMTGDVTNPNWARDRAVFFIIQQRAGDCRVEGDQ